MLGFPSRLQEDGVISLQRSHYRVKYNYTERETKGYRNRRHTVFSLIHQICFLQRQKKTNKLFNKQKYKYVTQTYQKELPKKKNLSRYFPS